MTKAPGKPHRKGMTLVEVVRVFSNEETATQWFIKTRWPNGVRCAHCDSDRIAERPNGKPQPYHCRECRKYFSVKTHTVMQSSKLPMSTWTIAFYIVSTGLRGTSSMKMHRDLGVTQKTAWHLAHRIRETWADQVMANFDGPVEMDEAYFGGKAKNMHATDRERRIRGRGTVDKTIVAGMKDRETNRISAAVVETTRKRELQAFADTAPTLHADEDPAMKKPKLPRILRRRDREAAYENVPEPSSMEELSRVCMRGPPKKRWRYLDGNDEPKEAPAR